MMIGRIKIRKQLREMFDGERKMCNVKCVLDYSMASWETQ